MNDINSTVCTCAACQRGLAGPVKFCPFCGTVQPQSTPAPADSTSAQTVTAARAHADSAVTAPAKPPATEPAAGSPGIEARGKPDAGAKQAATDKKADKNAAEKATGKAAEKAATDKTDKEPAEQAAEKSAAAAKGNRKTQEQQSGQSNPAANGGSTHATPGSGGGGKGKGWVGKAAALGIALLAVLWIKGSLQQKEEQQSTQEKLERQTTAAMTLAENCKLEDARAALLALDQAHGTPQQHATVQNAIRDAEPGCTKKLRQDAAWANVTVTVERALDNKNFDRAESTIKNFMSRWGDDDAAKALLETVNVKHVGALLDETETCLKSGDLACAEKNLPLAQARDQGDAKTRIASLQADLAAARERAAPVASVVQDAPAPVPQPTIAMPQARAKPAPSPAAAPTAPAQPAAASAVDARLAAMVNDAVKRIREGNYRGAEDLMSMCVSLDPGNQRCQELRHRANQMNRTMLACVASGKEWVNERCE